LQQKKQTKYLYFRIIQRVLDCLLIHLNSYFCKLISNLKGWKKLGYFILLSSRNSAVYYILEIKFPVPDAKNKKFPQHHHSLPEASARQRRQLPSEKRDSIGPILPQQ
jgi:hypothetical protein